jgi:hypothetical protein
MDADSPPVRHVASRSRPIPSKPGIDNAKEILHKPPWKRGDPAAFVAQKQQFADSPPSFPPQLQATAAGSRRSVPPLGRTLAELESAKTSLLRQASKIEPKRLKNYSFLPFFVKFFRTVVNYITALNRPTRRSLRSSEGAQRAKRLCAPSV